MSICFILIVSFLFLFFWSSSKPFPGYVNELTLLGIMKREGTKKGFFFVWPLLYRNICFNSVKMEMDSFLAHILMFLKQVFKCNWISLTTGLIWVYKIDHTPRPFFSSLKIQVFEKWKKLTFMEQQYWVKDCVRQCLNVFWFETSWYSEQVMLPTYSWENWDLERLTFSLVQWPFLELLL